MLEKSIVTHENCSAQYIEFWATSINAMNDTTERELYVNEFTKRVKLYAENKNTPLTAEQEIKLKTMGFEDIFIISFSGNKSYDKLDMWRGYGGNGYGICIEFDFDNITRFHKSNNGERLIMEDVYILTPCKYSKPEDILISDKLIQDTYNAIIAPHSPDLTTTLKEVGIRAQITDQSAIYKHVAYESENEYRMIAPSNNRIYHNKVGNFIKPYVKHRIPLCSIVSITIGPCIKESDVVKSIVKMIERILGYDVSIKYSKIPYRG